MPLDGTLDYIELPAADIPATKVFYRDLFDWRFTDYGPDYTEFDALGRRGGFNAERKVVKSEGPLLVIYANKLDEMEEKVKAAGGEITGHEKFPGGRRFTFRDPNGNEIGVWSKK
ncbi:hypothetical protein FHS83_002645 [Rhizomicrobium palustre]|uniref:VOC domain-containing protein n=1 Tax=Rhizomicrobium palustre TaxID=189966 RepID=A0A846N2G9_9PROT|nr:VOC family protein [Rhizomicrobium palustre]NIK89327.1 hypothetical protein [Rhizomicrobium palustre]